MKLSNVKIATVSEVQSGTSKTTGKPWASRAVLLSFEDELGENYLSAAVDADVWERLGFEQGQTVDLFLRCRTKRFNNNFLANDIRIVEQPNS